jgi:hypothetical protein
MNVYSATRLQTWFNQVRDMLGGNPERDDQIVMGNRTFPPDKRWHSDWKCPRGHFEFCQLLFDNNLELTEDVARANWVVIAQRQCHELRYASIADTVSATVCLIKQ